MSEPERYLYKKDRDNQPASARIECPELSTETRQSAFAPKWFQMRSAMIVSTPDLKQDLKKRIAFVFDDERFLVLHLMVAGRLYWRDRLCKVPIKRGLAAFDFPCGSLLITEASSKKRAALHFVKGRDELDSFDPGGLEVLAASIDEFRSALLAENHTLKRALTDPRIISGIATPTPMKSFTVPVCRPYCSPRN